MKYIKRFSESILPKSEFPESAYGLSERAMEQLRDLDIDVIWLERMFNIKYEDGYYYIDTNFNYIDDIIRLETLSEVKDLILILWYIETGEEILDVLKTTKLDIMEYPFLKDNI